VAAAPAVIGVGRTLAAALGSLALATPAFALPRGGRLLLLSLALLTTDYTLIDLVHTQPLLVAPFYRTGLLLIGELTYGPSELRGVIAVAGAALTVSFVVALAGSAAVPGGPGAALLAFVAAGGLLATPLLLLRRREADARRRPPPGSRPAR
jgi:hypothetical protein